jgi:hypothetical protein
VIALEVVSLVLLLAGNLFVLRWLVSQDPMDEADDVPAEGLVTSRDASHWRRAA